jgi:hypothetical protein
LGLEKFLEREVGAGELREFTQARNVRPFIQFRYPRERHRALVGVTHTFEGLVVQTHADE